MKKVLVIALALSFAAAAFGFQVGTYNGKPCYHTSDQMPWTMYINYLGTPDCSNEFNAIMAGMNTWSNVSGQWYRNAYGGTTTVMNYGYDSVRMHVWYEPGYPGQGGWPWGSGAVAVNAYWMSNQGSFYKVIHNDISYNGYNYTWSDSGESGKMDVQNISTHEQGHNLVLADLYDSGSREFTMYGYVGYGETKKRTLEYDDEDGIRYIYGYSGVKLESFTARAREGAVDVRWLSSSEENHAGYNLYRLEDNGAAVGNYVKLNEALIGGRSPYSWRDEGIASGRSYKYLLEAVDLSGRKEQFGPVKVETPSGIKATFALAQSYPNPARTTAHIGFSMATEGEATLTVYDLSGRRVATVASGPAAAGENEVAWNLCADNGARVAPGVYIYRLETPGNAAARRMVVAR